MNSEIKEKLEQLGYEGTKQHQAGQYVKAIELYSKSLEINPSDEATLILRGVANVCASEPLAAIHNLDTAIELDKEEAAFAYGFRGQLYYCMEDYDRALGDFKEAAIKKCSSADVFFKTGQINSTKYNTGDSNYWIDVCYNYQKAVEIAPDNETYQKTLSGAQKAKNRNKTVSILACCILPLVGSVTAGIFLGGFWWVVAGLLTGLLAGLISTHKILFGYDEFFRGVVIPSLSVLCAILAGQLLGGFWWVVAGLMAGSLIGVLIAAIDDDFVDDLMEAGPMVFFVGVPSLLGGILFGQLIGGFWWVLLGLISGVILGALLPFVVGGLLSTLNEKLGKPFTLFVFLFMTVGGIFAYVSFAGPWWVYVISVLIGGLFGAALYQLSSLYKNYKKQKLKHWATPDIAEMKRWMNNKAKERQFCKKRKEIEQNLSIEKKLALLEKKYHTLYEKKLKKLKEVKQEFSQMVSANDRKSPENLYKEYNRTEGVSKKRVRDLEEIAAYYAARCVVSVCNAKLESGVYTANRKKAVLFVERLKEIYDKLTANQKKRSIPDSVKTMQIGQINISIPDTLRHVNELSTAFRRERFEAIGESLSNFLDVFKLSDGDLKISLAYLGMEVIEGISAWFKHRKEIKENLEEAHDQLHYSIEKCEKRRLQADGFSKRAKEINQALEGTMNAYEKMFVEIYNTLYPPGDTSKSRKAREENKKNGGTYFSNNEADAVIQLRTTGQFLLNLVDAKFKGDNDG